MLTIKQCCHSSSQAPKFSADRGDWVLVIQGQKIFKGQVISFPTPESAELQLECDETQIVPAADIKAVMIED